MLVFFFQVYQRLLQPLQKLLHNMGNVINTICIFFSIFRIFPWQKCHFPTYAGYILSLQLCNLHCAIRFCFLYIAFHVFGSPVSSKAHMGFLGIRSCISRDLKSHNKLSWMFPHMVFFPTPHSCVLTRVLN